MTCAHSSQQWLAPIPAMPSPRQSQCAILHRRMFAASALAFSKIPNSGGPTPGNTFRVCAAPHNYCADLNHRVEPFKLEKLDQALELWWFFFGPVIAGFVVVHPLVARKTLLSPMFLEYLEAAQAEPKVTLESFPASLRGPRPDPRLSPTPTSRCPDSSFGGFHRASHSNTATAITGSATRTINRDTMRFLPVAKSRRLPGPFSSHGPIP